MEVRKSDDAPSGKAERGTRLTETETRAMTGQTLAQRVAIERIRADQDARMYTRTLRAATLRGENATRALCAPCPEPRAEAARTSCDEFILIGEDK